MTTAEDFITAILANPDKDVYLLEYSDWLEENGNREGADQVRRYVKIKKEMDYLFVTGYWMTREKRTMLQAVGEFSMKQIRDKYLTVEKCSR